MPTLLDTSAVVVMIRRHRPSEREHLAKAARRELAAGGALLSVITVAELLVGARDTVGGARLRELLKPFAVVPLDEEIARMAGMMGSYVRLKGALIPLPDLFIAATAVRLAIPVLTSDEDFARGRGIAIRDSNPGEEGELWRLLQLHPGGTTS